MAIVFTQERKKQKYLILALILIILITVAILWWGFLRTEKPPVVVPLFWREVKINFDALENPLLKELKIFEKIAPLEGQPGRENPFLPH